MIKLSWDGGAALAASGLGGPSLDTPGWTHGEVGMVLVYVRTTVQYCSFNASNSIQLFPIASQQASQPAGQPRFGSQHRNDDGHHLTQAIEGWGAPDHLSKMGKRLQRELRTPGKGGEVWTSNGWVMLWPFRQLSDFPSHFLLPMPAALTPAGSGLGCLRK
jgi:hypothetical protein